MRVHFFFATATATATLLAATFALGSQVDASTKARATDVKTLKAHCVMDGVEDHGGYTLKFKSEYELEAIFLPPGSESPNSSEEALEEVLYSENQKEWPLGTFAAAKRGKRATQSIAVSITSHGEGGSYHGTVFATFEGANMMVAPVTCVVE